MVVVVGNIVVGGGGKTPVVIALAEELRRQGLRPGVVSRGYGGTQTAPAVVGEDDDWRVVGDEPLLIFRRTGVPVCVGRKRAEAARKLAAAGCDVLLADDGLQHYAMHRDMEICVVNEEYRFGNGWPLPAGPLREGRRRAAACDITLVVGAGRGADAADAAAVEVAGLYPLHAPQQMLSLAELSGKRVVAVAGIARPSAFFAMLAAHGVVVAETRALPDHGRLADGDLARIRADVLLMTEKDAVKYPRNDKRLHALAIRCRLPAHIPARIVREVARRKVAQAAQAA